MIIITNSVEYKIPGRYVDRIMKILKEANAAPSDEEFAETNAYSDMLVFRYKQKCESGDTVSIGRITTKLKKRGIDVSRLGIKIKTSKAAEDLAKKEKIDVDTVPYTGKIVGRDDVRRAVKGRNKKKKK